MSTMVVHDITTLAATQSSSVKKNSESQSTITPFKKVLETEEAKTTKATKIIVPEKEDSAEQTTEMSSGKTTLKSIFKRASEKYNISYDFLVAVAKAESDFNADSVSHAGAQGIMQLMPETCKDLGVKNPFDVEENIMAAARLLKAHLKKFDGDYTLAAAAYNAGSGRVQQYGGVPPFTETQNYVKKIAKFMEEGVTVPDREVSVGNEDEYSGSGGSTGVEEEKNKKTTFDEGEKASDKDWEQVTVAVGTGDSAVTMTYGAYLRYLELGTTGVG